MGFDLNRGIPQKIFLPDGNGPERPFVGQMLESGQAGIMDRGDQCHKTFDVLQHEEKHCVCRIKGHTKKTAIKLNDMKRASLVFYDGLVLLGTPAVRQPENALRLVGYRADRKTYWVATDRHDLTAEQVAVVYKLRWDIETFFAWGKRPLRGGVLLDCEK